jgi:large subunit ribosomal protein L10e
MPLRPGRVSRAVKRPYTRVSKSVPRKSYVVGVPFPKTHQFEMGTKGDYDTIMYLISSRKVQIRDNALEASRIVSTKFLESKLGTSFFLKILVYPHNVIREHSIAQGAGADRFSQGMRANFGNPVGSGAHVRENQRLMILRLNKENIEIGKAALKRASLKLPTPCRIEIEQ